MKKTTGHNQPPNLPPQCLFWWEGGEATWWCERCKEHHTTEGPHDIVLDELDERCPRRSSEPEKR